MQEEALSSSEKNQSITMMRVNHTGEICAQALYRGQAVFARSKDQYVKLLQAAEEENNHLQWCGQRLQELNGTPSILEPFWQAGSFAIGALAGLISDKISLSFLAETEFQVVEHLEKHLKALPINDVKSRAILSQMQQDELKHATNALADGGKKLPLSIRWLMRGAAKIMTTLAGKV